MINQVPPEYNQAIAFRENDSNKVKALRKVFTSKWYIALIIAFSISVLIEITSIIYSGVTSSSFNASTVISLVLEVCLELVIPILFFRLLYLTNLVARGKAKAKYHDSILERIFAIQRFGKIFLTIMGIVYIFDGISYMSYNSLYSANAEYFTYLGITEEQIPLYVSQGQFNVFIGALFLVLAYASGAMFKVVLKNIVLDEKDNKFVEIFILIGILVLGALALIIGQVLELNGIDTFLAPGTINFSNFGDILVFFLYIMIAVFMLLGAYIFYKIYKVLKENNGSSGILDNANIYTVDADVINDDEKNAD